MTPELYQRLKPLHAAALDFSGEARTRFVAEACSSDLELRRELEALLAAHDERTGTLDRPIVDLRDFDLVPALSPGRVLLKRYCVVRRVGAGGMGEVYEVEDRFLQGVHVALKTILPNQSDDPDLQSRFEREVLLARELTHPNLCPMYDIAHCEEPAPGFLFLTMKLLPGTTLDERLKKGPPISPEDQLAILNKVAQGLVAIHTAGIVHRDIKPNNIMLDGTGSGLRLWITDFGLARAYQNEATVSGKEAIAGTPGYIAPELLLAGHMPSQASDLFAFGVVLHQVFTGEKPTHSPDGSSYVVSSRLVSPKVPAFCVKLVCGCLSDDPKLRCQAFGEALEVIDPKLDRGHYLSGRNLWTRRRFAGVAAASVCAVAGGAWWKWDDLDGLVHPIPQKRFVALLNWPKTSDARSLPMLTGVVAALKSELARAEAFDRNFFVVSADDPSTDAMQIAHFREVCDSLGANLILAASGLAGPNRFQVFLRLVDPFSGQKLRGKTLDCTLAEITSLPEKAVRAAGALLNLGRYLHDNPHAEPGTQSAAAFTAFQSAETLMKQPNDVGLDEAIEKYRQAAGLDPSYALTHAKLAWAYIHLYDLRYDPGALDLARRNYEHALALDPSLVEGHIARAMVLEDSGDEQEALKEFARALALDPSNSQTLLLQAQVYARLNRWTEAEQAYERILQQRPNYWLTYNEKAYAQDRQGKYQEAVQALRTATVSAPNSSFAFANLGGEYLEIGDFDRAAESSKRSMALKPNDLAAMYSSKALRLQGKYSQALSFALKAVELNPADDNNWLELGDCYFALGNRSTEAKSAYQRAAKETEGYLRTDPTNGPAYMRLALYRVKAGSSGDALSLVQKAEALGATDVNSQLYKTRVLELAGDRDAALATLATCYRKGATSFQIAPFPDFQSFRKDPRYLQLAQAHSAATPETN